MTTYEPTGPRISESQCVRTFNEDGDIISGIVTGVSEEGFDVKWEDMEHESNYNFSDINISKDFIYENLQTFLFKVYQTGFIEGCKQEEDVVKDMFKRDPVNFLLSNAIRYFTEAQLIALRDALIERTPPAPAQGVEEEEFTSVMLFEKGQLSVESFDEDSEMEIHVGDSSQLLDVEDVKELIHFLQSHVYHETGEIYGSRWQQGQQ